MTPVRLLITDDHTLVRAGIRALLTEFEAYTVIGEASDDQEALNLCALLQPEVVLMDIAMKGMGGLEALLQIRRDFPNIKVIMLSMHASEEYVLQALRNGAAGYLMKDAAREELKLALDSVVRGETYLSPRVSKSVVEEYLHRVNAKENSAEILSPRQQDILRRIAEGQSTKEIAYQLGVSSKTVETHRAQLMERLGIHDIPGLVRYAVRTKLVSAEK